MEFAGTAVNIVAWFVSSAVCTSSSKQALNLLAPLRCSFSVTALQFALSSALGTAVCLCLGRRLTLPREALPRAVCIGFVYTAGFALLNLSLGRLAASFAETVRGLEAIFTALFACVFNVRGGRLGVLSAAALATLIVGAAAVCYSQPQLSVPGLLLGLSANLMFAARSLLTTAAQDKFGKQAFEANALFLHQHLVGLALLLPIAGFSSGSECVAHAVTNPSAVRAALLSASAFFAYNRLSLSVLLILNAVSHSVCNALRRAATIGAAAIIFGTPLDTLSVAGITLIILGSTAYALAAAREQKMQSTPEPAELQALKEEQRGMYPSQMDTAEGDARETDRLAHEQSL